MAKEQIKEQKAPGGRPHGGKPQMKIDGKVIKRLLTYMKPFRVQAVLVAVCIALGAFLLARFARVGYHKNEERLTAIANIFDAAGLGSFVVVGMEAGINAGYGDNGFFLVFLGLLTCIGGGLLRDLFVQRMPGVLHKHVYALPCILGGVLYLVMIRQHVSDLISIPVVMLFIFTFRMLATKYHWNLPHAE